MWHLGGALGLWYLKERRRGGPASIAGISRRLRVAAERLGPTYIKLGQIIASGDGIFPPELVAEFKWCRDQVPPEPWPVVERVLIEELGRPIGTVFASVEHAPLAAASIAQVHAATLRDGTPVVVKVQRPSVSARVRQDLAVMAWLAPHLVGRIPVAALANPPALVELFAETIMEELDFRLEAENMLDIAMTFAALDQRDFVVPRPHPTLVTRRMLVMERLDGFNFGDVEGMHAAGIDTEAVVRAGMIGFLEGAMIHGIFHGDLHGGNLFVLPSGKIALLDFGITGRLTEPKRLALLSLLVGASNGHIPSQVAALRDLGAFPDDVDVQHVIDLLGLDRPPVDPVTLTPDELVAEMQRSIKTLLGLGRPHAQGADAVREEHDVPRRRHRHPGPRPRPVRRGRGDRAALRGQARRADHVPARPRAPGGLGARHGGGQGGLRAGRVDPEPHPPRAPGPPGRGAREVRPGRTVARGRGGRGAAGSEARSTSPEYGRRARVPATRPRACDACRRADASPAVPRSPSPAARPRTGRIRCSLG